MKSFYVGVGILAFVLGSRYFKTKAEKLEFEDLIIGTELFSS